MRGDASSIGEPQRPSVRLGRRRRRHGSLQEQVRQEAPLPGRPRPRLGPGPADAALSRRYVLCEVVSEDPRCRQCIEDRAVGLAVRDAIGRVHGDYGLACCSISFTGAPGPRGGDEGGSPQGRAGARISPVRLCPPLRPHSSPQ